MPWVTVRFENLPAYNSSGNNMSYGAYESPVEDFDALFDGDTKQAAKQANIHDYQIYSLYQTVEEDTDPYSTYAKNGEEVQEKAADGDTTYLDEPDTDSYFSCHLSDQEGTDHGNHYRHYLYQGSAQAYSKQKKNSTSTGARAENGNASFAPVSHINMLNTLPLTAVTVQKHWDDQNNQFNLRPSAINDVNQTGKTVVDQLNLTLYRRLETTDWKPIGYTEDANHQTEWYVHSYTNAQNQTVNGVKIPVSNDKKNEWTYTYYKLLKADKNNTPYNFKIVETKLNPYYEPQYCALAAVSNGNYTNKQIITAVTVNNSNSNDPKDQLDWDGTHPLVETFEITNKLETIDVIVAKSWDDNDYDSTKAEGLHYNVKATLSSDDITMLATGKPYTETGIKKALLDFAARIGIFSNYGPNSKLFWSMYRLIKGNGYRKDIE